MVFRIPRPRRYGRLSALGTVLVLVAVGATAVAAPIEPGQSTPIVGAQSGRCLTVPGSSTTNGTQTSAGPRMRQPPTPASGPRSTQSSRRTRNYLLRVPADYDNDRPYRLVFGVHAERRHRNASSSRRTMTGCSCSYYACRPATRPPRQLSSQEWAHAHAPGAPACS